MSRDEPDRDNTVEPGDHDDAWLDASADQPDSEDEDEAPVPDIDDAPVKVKSTSDEDVRMVLLILTFALLFITVTAAFFVAVWGSPESWDRVSQLLQAIIPVETLVLGAAVSYYFKSE